MHHDIDQDRLWPIKRERKVLLVSDAPSEEMLIAKKSPLQFDPEIDEWGNQLEED